VRKPFADLHERVMLGHCGIRKPVESAAGALEHASAHETEEILARDANGLNVARSHDS
jgi:hypothetical protein